MAIVTCKVVRAQIPVPSVYVILDCQHHSLHRFVVQATTDENGGIMHWYPFPLPNDSTVIQPALIQVPVATYVCCTFLFPGYDQSPWRSIVTEVCLPQNTHHGIVLHLGASPRLEHQPYPVAGPQNYQIVPRLEAFLNRVVMERLLPSRYLPPVSSLSGEQYDHREHVPGNI